MIITSLLIKAKCSIEMRSKKASNKGLFLPIIIASVLIVIWFRKGLMMGGGEIGIPFYDVERLYEVSSNVWLDIILGFPAPQVLAGSLFYLVVSWFEGMGVLPFVFQALTFWFLLVIGSCSVYVLTNKISGGSTSVSAPILSAFFYILNPFSMTLVWHRFQLTFMFFYAMLPLSLLLVIEGIEQKKYVYAGLLGLISATMAYSFAETPFIGTFWLIIISYFIYYILINLHEKYSIFFALKFLLATLIMWILLNSWWFIPLFSVASSILGEFTTSSGNISTLLSISEHSGPIYTLRLIHWYYTYIETTWGNIYSSIVFELIASIIPVIVFSTSLIRKKTKLLVYFISLALLISFLTKGAAPPFGDIFVWVFRNVQYFQVYRNPVEKFGIALPLAYSPLFGIGLTSLYEYVNRRMNIHLRFGSGKLLNLTKSLALTLIFLLTFSTMGLYAWPMWTGSVFTSPYVPANNPQVGIYVSVPSYYENARNWLSNDNQTYRLIVLPVTTAGITYTWKYGYSGVELSNLLFGRESVSLAQGIGYTDKIILNLDKLLVSTSDFWKIMAILNAKYVVLRPDINWSLPYRDMTDPSLIANALNYTLQPSISEGLVDQTSTDVKALLPNTPDKSLISAVWVNSSLPYTFVFSNDTKQSNYSIKFEGEPSYFPPGNYSLLSFYYYLPSNLRNWSGMSYLLMWVKSNVSGKLLVSAQDAQGAGLAWDGRLQEQYQISSNETGSWKLIVLPINFPSYGNVNLNDVSKILIGLVTYSKYTHAYLSVGGLFVDKGTVKATKHISREIAFGPLVFYKLDDKYFLPRIYTITAVIHVENLDQFLFSLIQSQHYDPRKMAVLVDDQSQSIRLSNQTPLANSPPKIAFERLNPAEYLIHVYNAQGPFILVLSETYDPRWMAYYGNVDWLSSYFVKSIPNQAHFIVNGYANAWYIDKTGNYTITLFFEPQRLLVLGSIISIASVMSFTTVVVYVERDLLSNAIIRTTRYLNRKRSFLSQ